MLVFPTVDGSVIAGPTAHDQADKTDWSVRPSRSPACAAEAARLLPALEHAEPIATYAGCGPRGAAATT